MVFADRIDAAQRLAQQLSAYRGRNPLILAIPRGAVEMGRVLVDRLAGELHVVLVRKLRAPVSSEFAIGSIDETGWAYVAPYAMTRRLSGCCARLARNRRCGVSDAHLFLCGDVMTGRGIDQILPHPSKQSPLVDHLRKHIETLAGHRE